MSFSPSDILSMPMHVGAIISNQEIETNTSIPFMSRNRVYN